MPPAGRFLKKAPQKLSGILVKPESYGLPTSVKQANSSLVLFIKFFKSLAPGRAAGGNIELNSYDIGFHDPHDGSALWLLLDQWIHNAWQDPLRRAEAQHNGTQACKRTSLSTRHSSAQWRQRPNPTHLQG